MNEFGCSVVVPRKELAAHMKESEIQHLTAMTRLNLQLTRQLQHESAERDMKIEKLQQEVAMLRDEQKQSQLEMKLKLDKTLDAVCAEQNTKLGEVHSPTPKFVQVPSPQREAGGTADSGSSSDTVTKCFTFRNYNYHKGKNVYVDSDHFEMRGYNLKLRINFYSSPHNDIGTELFLMDGKLYSFRVWPKVMKVRMELLNQAADTRHVVRTATCKWTLDKVNTALPIENNLIKYTTLERVAPGVRYMMNDSLKFKIIVTDVTFSA
jgi:hypothetical protein